MNQGCYPAPLTNINGPSSEVETLALLRSPSDSMRSPVSQRILKKKLITKKSSHSTSSGENGVVVPSRGSRGRTAASGMMQPMPSESDLSTADSE